VTLTLEFLPAAVQPPAVAIPSQPKAPSVLVSLTDGCDAPLDALKLAPLDHDIQCHPCDEAIVRLLMARIRRTDGLQISYAIAPGTLRLG
jgi:hypothetical protein